jgi:copper ion binding protein
VVELKLKIDGMSCPHCKKALETAIGQLEGVHSVQVDLEANLATIQVEDEGLKDKIRETIIEAGYTPE